MKLALTKAQANDTIQALIHSSQLFLVLEFRGFDIETIKYIDKKTQQKAQFSQMVFRTEGTGAKAEQITCTMRIPDEYEVRDLAGEPTILPKDPATPMFDVGMAKGQKCIFCLSGYEVSQGQRSADVKSYSPIEPEGVSKK